MIFSGSASAVCPTLRLTHTTTHRLSRQRCNTRLVVIRASPSVFLFAAFFFVSDGVASSFDEGGVFRRIRCKKILPLHRGRAPTTGMWRLNGASQSGESSGRLLDLTTRL